MENGFQDCPRPKEGALRVGAARRNNQKVHYRGEPARFQYGLALAPGRGPSGPRATSTWDGSERIFSFVHFSLTHWDLLMRSHHHLGLRCLAGRSLRSVAEWHGEWIALLGRYAPAPKCGPRDAWVGWPPISSFSVSTGLPIRSFSPPPWFPFPLCSPRPSSATAGHPPSGG